MENDANIAISWLRNNKMIANPDKIQCIILSKNKADNIVEVNIENRKVSSQTSVKLLGITIDNKLHFNEHISKLCKSASAQLNAIFRLRYKLPFKAKHILKLIVWLTQVLAIVLLFGIFLRQIPC